MNSDTQAILLLTGRFSKATLDAINPLSASEWARLFSWLTEHSLSPAQLLSSHIGRLLDGWSDRSITVGRVERLLERGMALALATEKWDRIGIWTVSQCDPDYPNRLLQHLRKIAPPVLYGCGNRALLSDRGLAIVGSRNAGKLDIEFAKDLGALTAAGGYSVISGCARGIDEASMMGALLADGTSVGILPNGLSQSCSSKVYRKYLAKNQLVLISPFHPDARFTSGNAMGRNKYIYCLSEAAVVVQSGRSGGTWNGARENLRNSWVPLWVRDTSSQSSGNLALTNFGAKRLPEDIQKVRIIQLMRSESQTRSRTAGQLSLGIEPTAAMARFSQDENSTAHQDMPVATEGEQE